MASRAASIAMAVDARNNQVSVAIRAIRIAASVGGFDRQFLAAMRALELNFGEHGEFLARALYTLPLQRQNGFGGRFSAWAIRWAAPPTVAKEWKSGFPRAHMAGFRR